MTQEEAKRYVEEGKLSLDFVLDLLFEDIEFHKERAEFFKQAYRLEGAKA